MRNLRCFANGRPSDAALGCLLSCVALAAAVVGPSIAQAAEADETPAALRELTGKPWIDMDYGPSLTLTLEAGRDNFAYKGIAIRLDAGPGGVSQGEEFVIFDTDTLRYAAGWMGPQFIDWRCIHFNGEHAVHPRLAGAMLFQNPPAPGWAEPGSSNFDDDRLLGRDGRRYGPLDRQHAHWKGHYYHGNQVILSYTVGQTDVLEMPTPLGEGDDELRGFARTLNIGPREHDLLIQIAQQPSAEIAQHTRDNNTQSPGYVSLTSEDFPRGDREDEEQEEERDREDKDDEEEAENEEDETAEDNDLDAERGIDLDGGLAGIVEAGDDFDLVGRDYTVWAVVETQEGGTIFAEAPAVGSWAPGSKVLFIGNGQLAFDVGWEGVVATRLDRPIDDGDPHEVAMTFAHQTNDVKLYVDGKLAAEGELAAGDGSDERVVKLGFASPDFPERQSALVGYLDEVRFYNRALDQAEVAAVRQDEELVRGLVAQWDRVQDGVILDRSGKHHAEIVEVEQEADDEEWDEDEPAEVSGFGPRLGNVLCVGLVGSPSGCEWITTDDGNVRFKIPAGDEPVRLKIAYARVEGEEQVDRFEELLDRADSPMDLNPLTHGGPSKWTETVSTEPAVLGGADGPYVAETITAPHENPYRSWMRLGGFDFYEDGSRAAVCTWQGDVWIVDGIGSDFDTESSLTWRRIASGMFQPLGLKIVDGDVYVTCRDQITILRDFNGDGETDFYENFNNDHQVTDHFHEFAVGLQTDDEGNFYYAKCARHALDALVPHHGTLLKVSKDGSKSEILARGYRAPNGVCVNPDGTFFLSDQEGHWTPKNRINWVKPGGFYGNMMAYHDGRSADDFEPPVCWIHNDYDRSPAEQLWVTSDKWGPLNGSLLTLSYGTGEIHLVLHEEVDGVMQGGLVRLPITDFPTGIMRGRFHPGDGQLYACGLFGWSSNKTAPGGFYRIRYTEQPVNLPVELHATAEGLVITFTEPLDRASATNYRNWTANRWQYRRTQNYGSDDYRIEGRARRGRDRVRIDTVELSADGRTVHLKIRDMQPAMQMEVRYSIKSAAGEDVSNLIHHTVHQLGAEAALPESQ